MSKMFWSDAHTGMKDGSRKPLPKRLTPEERMVPEDGVNPYADHPGFSATTCPDRITITQRGPYGSISGCGFACSRTGGHCLPESCQVWQTLTKNKK